MLYIVAISLLFLSFVSGVTIYNDRPRLTDTGDVVDCHSGVIIKQNNRYFMYGEYYGFSTGFNTTDFPKLIVYSSQDLVTWTNHGIILNLPGSQFTPWAAFNAYTNKFVIWFNSYPQGCCAGEYGVAVSSDGIIWNMVGYATPVYTMVDGSTLFVDDDGTGYLIYTSLSEDHKVSIEKLTPDYLNTTGENYGLFPDRYVEGAILFKRKGLYYVGYGSCCCFCRGGSGAAFFFFTKYQRPLEEIRL